MCQKCDGKRYLICEIEGKPDGIQYPCTCDTGHPAVSFLRKHGADEKLSEYVLKPHEDQALMRSLRDRNEKILLISGDFGRAKTTMLLKLACWYEKKFFNSESYIFYMDAAEFFNLMALSSNVTDYYDLQNETWNEMLRPNCHHVFIDDVGQHKLHGDVDSDTFRRLLKIPKRLALTTNFFLKDVDKKKNPRKEETLLRSIFNPGCIDILDSDQCLNYETEGPSFR